MNRLTRLLVLVALAATPALALAASGSGKVWVTNCTKEQYRPGTIVLACGDGDTYLQKLHWSAWAGSAASASGTYTANDCSPSCVRGHFHSYPVTVALSKPKSCRHQRHKVFDDIAVMFTGKRPANTPKTLKIPLGCPY